MNIGYPFRYILFYLVSFFFWNETPLEYYKFVFEFLNWVLLGLDEFGSDVYEPKKI